MAVGIARTSMMTWMYRLNVAAATLCGLLSLFLCLTYTLPQPHYVGHVVPAAAAFMTAIWAVHCLLLLAASGDQCPRRARALWLLPMGVAMLAMVACVVRYQVQLSAP